MFNSSNSTLYSQSYSVLTRIVRNVVPCTHYYCYPRRQTYVKSEYGETISRPLPRRYWNLLSRGNRKKSNRSLPRLEGDFVFDRQSGWKKKKNFGNNTFRMSLCSHVYAWVRVRARTLVCIRVVWHTRGPDDDRSPLLVVTLIQWYPISHPTHPSLSLIPPAIIIFINCRSGAYILHLFAAIPI